MRRIAALPNLLTLGNAFCGLLAIAKGIDALAIAGGAGELAPDVAAAFYAKLETACRLIFLGMVFDALDGKVARFTGGQSAFGAQLDSFSDALTFGCAPALLAKILIEHEGPALGYAGHPRLHFVAAAVFALMAILRLARFNLETSPDPRAHAEFKGLPSPAAAGAVAATVWLFLTLRSPKVEYDDGTPTPVGMLLAWFPELRAEAVLRWWLPALAVLLVVYGALMVSRVRYVHAMAWLTKKRSFFFLVYLVFTALLLYAVASLFLFVAFQAFVVAGLARHLLGRRDTPDDGGDADATFEDEVLSGSAPP
jgi:CDP-diacylglycerol--serine O-phosphatidyltransferase